MIQINIGHGCVATMGLGSLAVDNLAVPGTLNVSVTDTLQIATEYKGNLSIPAEYKGTLPIAAEYKANGTGAGSADNHLIEITAEISELVNPLRGK